MGFEETELHYGVENNEDNDQFEQECDEEEGIDDDQSDEESSSEPKPKNLSIHSHESFPTSGAAVTLQQKRPPAAPSLSILRRSPPAAAVPSSLHQNAAASTDYEPSSLQRPAPSSSQRHPPSASTPSSLQQWHTPATSPSSLHQRLSPSGAPTPTSYVVNSSQPMFDKPMTSSPSTTKPLMSPEMRAQLGYTNLLAKAASSHRLLANQLPFLLAQPNQATLLSHPNQVLAQPNQTSIADLLPREPLPQFAVADTQPTQAPENLSLNKHGR